jgi:hypothetical protein
MAVRSKNINYIFREEFNTRLRPEEIDIFKDNCNSLEKRTAAYA